MKGVRGLYMKLLLVFLITGVLVGCKGKKSLVLGEVNTALTTKKIIQSHYSNAPDFRTLSGRVRIDYFDGDKKQGVTVNLRMKKDEAIWVSAPLGIFKAYITPNRVSFYNKLEGEYFDGDFEFLSDLLGTQMDFEKMENLLLGNTVLDLRKERYVSSVSDNSYRLQPRSQQALYNVFFTLEPRFFRAKRQELTQPQKNRILTMDYAYQDIDGNPTPSVVLIEAANRSERTSIQLDFKNIEFNKALNFPYKIPKGFKSVVSR